MPRAKGQPVKPKIIPFCIECIAAGFHRADCPTLKVVPKTGGRRRKTAPTPAPETNDAPEE